MSNIQKDVLANVKDMPEDWDGLEMRKFIADKFAEEAYVPLLGKRKTAYEKTVALLYAGSH